jgi:hypothetical protein
MLFGKARLPSVIGEKRWADMEKAPEENWT